ncbi:MAG: hypothetical protein DCC49_13350 [Acidobacteria bacterium]|nr:MAG: hypothetical protein DCC49_13350 [Acidobacteriota bacterium]
MARRKRHRDDKNRAYHWARERESPLIAELFPAFESVVIEMEFADDWGDMSPRSRVLNREDGRDYVHIECPNRECVDGGFDLTGAVHEAIRADLSTAEGQAQSCQGWQDRERIGNHRCLTRLTYRMDIRYVAETEPGPNS